jgi:membrane AbrB-like protein
MSVGRSLGLARGSIGVGAQWAALLVASIVAVALLDLLRLPAALLLGPMAAAILVAASGGTARVPGWTFTLAQGVIGAMVAGSLTPSTLTTIAADWPMFAGGVIAVIALSYGLGWLLARWRVLPGATAIWGASPGAATAMTLMAEAWGADIRLVAFMQYLRVVFVAIAASGVARFWVNATASAPDIVWFPPVPWGAFAATLVLAVGGAGAGRRLRIPAGPLLLPLALAVLAHGVGGMTIVLPPWLLAASYALVGWSIGLRFTRPILFHALRALPRVVASIIVLILGCGGLAFLLHRFAGIDPLSAYLATSPGGVDSVAIIAASAKVDLPFIMAMQTTRLVLVLALGPGIARFIARRVDARNAQEEGR